jgi:Rrf2 family transcriptional regulator, iron-sulfur cluster assembly transcription factor
MRLTRGGEYAIRCILYLSCLGGDRVASRREVALAMDIPSPFLGKLAQDLARAGFISILQGAQGGYKLRRPAEEITLLEVVEAVEGEIPLNDCLMRPENCGRSSLCSVHRVWDKARRRLRETLAEATFAQLAGEEMGKSRGNPEKA